MKKVFTFLAAVCLIACTGNDPDLNYIDLGLTSGNLWKNTNEINPIDSSEYFSGDQIDAELPQYSDYRLYPTSYDWEELWTECEWTWTGAGYTIVGPNGNTITLPALGMRDEDGTIIRKDSVCEYWERSGYYSGRWRWFDDKRICVSNMYSTYGAPIRRVKRAEDYRNSDGSTSRER